MKSAIRIAVTGAAGQIGYALLFRIAAGEMLGKDQPAILQLLDLPQAQKALHGVMMELQDGAFSLLVDMFATDDPEVAFQDAQIALLIGSRPRTQGMERADLLNANAAIFRIQGAALNKVANRNVKVLVVGNPANTNAYIAMKSAPNLPPENFSALLRLDQNRAFGILASKIGQSVSQIDRVCVWGNHSLTMYPDYRYGIANGEKIINLIKDATWNAGIFLPSVAKRGAAIIQARGLSSAASAASACIDHMRDWLLGSNGRWVTMGVSSDGSYGIPKGLIFGFPVICEDGDYQIVQGLSFDSFSQQFIDTTLAELEAERTAVEHLIAN